MYESHQTFDVSQFHHRYVNPQCTLDCSYIECNVMVYLCHPLTNNHIVIKTSISKSAPHVQVYWQIHPYTQGML